MILTKPQIGALAAGAGSLAKDLKHLADKQKSFELELIESAQFVRSQLNYLVRETRRALNGGSNGGAEGQVGEGDYLLGALSGGSSGNVVGQSGLNFEFHT
jgi:hypothetical protein